MKAVSHVSTSGAVLVDKQVVPVYTSEDGESCWSIFLFLCICIVCLFSLAYGFDILFTLIALYLDYEPA